MDWTLSTGPRGGYYYPPPVYVERPPATKEEKRIGGIVAMVFGALFFGIGAWSYTQNR